MHYFAIFCNKYIAYEILLKCENVCNNVIDIACSNITMWQ